MARVKSSRHPSGRSGTRDQRFFSQLKGLGGALDRIIKDRPDTSGGPPVDDRAEREAKRAAKMARRAEAARRAGLLP